MAEKHGPTQPAAPRPATPPRATPPPPAPRPAAPPEPGLPVDSVVVNIPGPDPAQLVRETRNVQREFLTRPPAPAAGPEPGATAPPGKR
jgi:hypothetical protein